MRITQTNDITNLASPPSPSESPWYALFELERHAVLDNFYNLVSIKSWDLMFEVWHAIKQIYPDIPPPATLTSPEALQRVNEELSTIISTEDEFNPFNISSLVHIKSCFGGLVEKAAQTLYEKMANDGWNNFFDSLEDMTLVSKLRILQDFKILYPYAPVEIMLADAKFNQYAEQVQQLYSGFSSSDTFYLECLAVLRIIDAPEYGHLPQFTVDDLYWIVEVYTRTSMFANSEFALTQFLLQLKILYAGKIEFGEFGLVLSDKEPSPPSTLASEPIYTI